MSRSLFLIMVAVLGPMSPARATPVSISEVLYDAAGSDDGMVFVELFGPAGLALTGFALEGVNGSNGQVGPLLALAGAIPSDGFFVVADLAGAATSVPAADLLLNFDFQNGPDSIRLRDPNGAVVDALGYGVFGAADIFAGEGTPAPDAAAGQSLARRFADLDSDDNFADFELLDTPTPGQGPIQLPEPSALLLGWGAWLGAVMLRLRRADPPGTSR